MDLKNKKEILDLVREYAKNNLSNINTDFKLGDAVRYSGKVFDEEEVVSLVDCSLDFWLTQGRFYDEFEKKLCEYLGVKFSSFVNSGSSANLLAISTLTSKLLKDRALSIGDEIITVACGFPTTVAPIIQNGLVPVFLDVDIPTYNVNINEVENSITKKTRAVFLAHTLGNPFDINFVREICKKHNLWLIEDNCDALGAEVLIDGKYQLTGSIGDIATSSFYPAHHITTGEGGAVYTNDALLHKIIESMRDWGRDCVCKSGIDNTCKKRFIGQYGDLPYGYDHKYVYSHFGYNLKASDMQAAIGVKQIEKLPSFVEKRRKNFDLLYKMLKENSLDEYFILPEKTKDTKPSWFSFILTCRDNVDREKVVKFLDENNVHTRMLFAGNIIKQPMFIGLDKNKYRVASDLKNTDRIMEKTFMVGVYPKLNEKSIEYMVDVIKKSVR